MLAAGGWLAGSAPFPSAVSTVHGSAPEDLGAYPSASAWVSEENCLLCSRPQAQLDGAPPSVAVRCATAALKADRITAAAVRCWPRGEVNAALPGSRSVHASRSSSRLTCPGDTFSPMRSLRTGTFAAVHHGWNTADR